MFIVPNRRPIRQRLAHTARRIALVAAVRVLDRLEAAAGEQTTPAAPALVEAAAPAVETTPAGPVLLAAAELPSVETIEAAAAEYADAAEQARQGDRGKRRARKLLDLLPAGTYGRATVERITSARQTPDMDEITRVFAELGRDVPMRPVADSLRVTLTPAAVEAVAVAA
ncbi:hypothetical protein [Parafrankia sp. FMc2]|uniref:hypothetical protein n=1 Tax=Parafrankia sp. FMc2 TaxID=3233196 RepID=UPI0034D5F785